MSHDPYGDPDLVTLYEIDNPAGRDHEFYRTLATEIDARTIVDLGCGTGLLARSLAAPGRTVLGVDPSATMIEFARRQPGAESVSWIEGDATAIPRSLGADLVICTGNAMQHIEPVELSQTLSHIVGALRVGGVFSFDSRNPDARAWEGWTPQATTSRRQTPFGHLREWLEVTHVDASGRVVFDAHNVIDGGTDRVFTSVLYFRTAHEFTRHLTSAGFTEVAVAGDWGSGPVTDTSALLVVRAVRR